MITEIKEEHGKISKQKAIILESMEKLEIKEELITQLETLVTDEVTSNKIKQQFEELSQKVFFTDKEQVMLNFDKDLDHSEEFSAVKLFEKLLTKIEIFESVNKYEQIHLTKRSNPLNVDDKLEEEKQVHINQVVQEMEDVKSSSKSYFTSLFNYLTSSKVKFITH